MMRSNAEIAEAQAKLIAVLTGVMAMPEEFYHPTKTYRLECMANEMGRILTLAPGETVKNRRAEVYKLLDGMIAASPGLRDSMIAYHHGELEEIALPIWCVNLITMVYVLDWALGKSGGEDIAENLAAIDAYSAIGNHNARKA